MASRADCGTPGRCHRSVSVGRAGSRAPAPRAGRGDPASGIDAPICQDDRLAARRAAPANHQGVRFSVATNGKFTVATNNDRGPVRIGGPCVSRGAQAGGVRPLPPPATRRYLWPVRPYAVPRRTRRRGDAVRGEAGSTAWGRRRAGPACACCPRVSSPSLRRRSRRCGSNAEEGRSMPHGFGFPGHDGS